uniref:Tachykinin receptor 1a n=1 Tax=Astyanax mexicanus TaxID=7994 RepID=A0A8B9R9G8_ASTMX
MDPPYTTTEAWPGNWSALEPNGTDGYWNQFVQPMWRIALWAVAYSVIVVVSVVGNVTVVWIILAHRRMRTVTNYFLVNLAFAEASMSAFNTVVNFVYAAHNEWYFGLVYCRFHNFFPIAAVFAIGSLYICCLAETYIDSLKYIYICIIQGFLVLSTLTYHQCVVYCLLGSQFRIGFKQAFRWCPCVTASPYEGLELKSTRYLQTQTSVYKASRMETTVSAVMPAGVEDAAKSGARRTTPVHSPSLELTSNGSSSRSMSKTVSETSSFYSSNNLPA